MTDTTNNDEPTRDAPLVSVAARSNGKASALVDQILDRADERGIRVQVVKSNTPTREQIAHAIRHNDVNRDDVPGTNSEDWYLDNADAVLALFSQPSPSTPSTEPDRIEDMAPGDVEDAALVDRVAAAIFEVRDDADDLRDWDEVDGDERERYQCDARAALAALNSNVTPPPALPEDGR